MTYSCWPILCIKNNLMGSSWPCFRLQIKEQKVTTFSQSFFLTCIDQHTLLSDLVVLTWDSSSSHFRILMKTRWKRAGWNYHWISNSNVQKQPLGRNCLWNGWFACPCGENYWSSVCCQDFSLPTGWLKPYSLETCGAYSDGAWSSGAVSCFWFKSPFTHQMCLSQEQKKKLACSPRLSCAPADVQSVPLCCSGCLYKLYITIHVDKLQIFLGDFFLLWEK